jgi:hypothetical protein
MALPLYEPTVLLAQIERPDDSATLVEWRLGRIQYIIPGAAKLALFPDQEAWLAFWEEIADVGFWDWPADCDAIEGDGTRWLIDIRFRGRRHRARGSNAFPPRFGEFCIALTRLMNGADFS